MKEALPVIAAGGTFAGATLAGLLIGIFIGGRTGQPVWAFVGLIVGLGAGAYSAVRLLFRAK
ncbi:MAG: AtpZ/AtpI family protein [Candidatus Eremiobacteraeota bacterium]|nr:AtpZ/AtpI family protein [Candidatus Eremiobacteraeota bacterium]